MGEKIDVQWYKENYTPWIDGINSYGDLEKFWDNLNPRYKRRFDHWFKDIELVGSVLELGFNNGKTLKWLGDKYKERVILWGYDFNPNLMKIREYLFNINSIMVLDIANILSLNYRSRMFNHIICLDFLEHLYHDDYLKAIDKMGEIIENEGRVYVFAGYAKLPEHVNILTLEETKEDFTAAGFKFMDKIKYPETGDTMQIFEK